MNAKLYVSKEFLCVMNLSRRYEEVPTEDSLPSWESLRKQARHLEYQIDSRLVTLSQAAASSNPNTTIQQELSSLLTSLGQVTQDMGVYVERNPSYSHLHSRHLANLYEYNREFKKARTNIQHAQEHIELMSGGAYTRTSSFANQHSRMEQTHQMVDEILQ
jgi:Golgi SNAP receptor complex protein 1